MSMGSLDSGWVGLAGAPGQAGREEHGAVAEGLAGEADAGVRGDLLAGLLEISGGAEDPPGGGLPHFGDGKEEADGALAEVLGELDAEVLVQLGGGGGLDGDGGAALDSHQDQVGEPGGGEEGGAGLTQGTGEAGEGAAAEDGEGQGAEGAGDRGGGGGPGVGGGGGGCCSRGR